MLDRASNYVRGTYGIDEFLQPEDIHHRIWPCMDNSPINQVIRGEIPYYLTQNFIEEYPDVVTEMGAHPDVRSHIIVPLVAQGVIIGAVAADNLVSQLPISAEILPDLLTFAELAAVTLDQLQNHAERKRLYARAEEHIRNLKEMNKALQEALVVNEEMSQNVAHELRTPLTHIRGNAELLAMEVLGPLTEEQQQAIKVIDVSSAHLQRLVDDLLLLRRIETETLHLSPVSLAELVLETCQGYESRAEAAGIKLRSQAAAHIPLIQGDRERLTQVLGNLLDNALQFSPQGTTVHVMAWVDAPWVCCSVKDEGVGISPDKLTTIFKRFYQVDSERSRQRGGLGIGLTIVHAIVEAHGGRIWAESEAGQGAMFCVQLPMTLEAETD